MKPFRSLQKKNEKSSGNWGYHGGKYMENYDLNIHWGIKTIKVTFQIGKYKGYVTYRVKGNTKGASLLRVDADDLYNMTFVDNNAQLKDLGDEWYSMVLKGEHGEELIDEGEWDDLSDYIVAVEIIDMVSEEDWSTNDGNQGRSCINKKDSALESN